MPDQEEVVVANILNIGEVRPSTVDWFLSAGAYDGTVSLILGGLDPAASLEPGPHVRVQANLKMSLPFAGRLVDLLQNIIADARAEAANAQQNEANEPLS